MQVIFQRDRRSECSPDRRHSSGGARLAELQHARAPAAVRHQPCPIELVQSKTPPKETVSRDMQVTVYRRVAQPSRTAQTGGHWLPSFHVRPLPVSVVSDAGNRWRRASEGDFGRVCRTVHQSQAIPRLMRGSAACYSACAQALFDSSRPLAVVI